MKRRTKCNHNIRRYPKIIYLDYLSDTSVFLIATSLLPLVEKLGNVILEHFCKIFGGKSISFEILQKFRVFYKRHTAFIIIICQFY